MFLNFWVGCLCSIEATKICLRKGSFSFAGESRALAMTFFDTSYGIWFRYQPAVTINNFIKTMRISQHSPSSLGLTSSSKNVGMEFSSVCVCSVRGVEKMDRILLAEKCCCAIIIIYDGRNVKKIAAVEA